MNKLIIFDLGKVIFDVSFDRVYSKWAEYSGLSVENIRQRFTFAGAYEKFERADISESDFRTEIGGMLGIKISKREFDEGWNDLYLEEYIGIYSLLEELSKEHDLAALSNTNSIHARVWKNKYARTLGLFGKVFSSYEMKCRKPEREAYETVMRHFCRLPGQTIFLDDNYDNIVGAEELGIESILVDDTVQLRMKLLKILNRETNG